MTIKTYDLDEVVVSINGILVEGFQAEGEALTITTPELYTHVAGLNNSDTRVRINNKLSTVVLNVMQTSNDNDILNGFYQLDQAANAGVFLFSFTEISTGTIVTDPNAYIAKAPDISRADDLPMNAWTINLPRAAIVYGGSK